MVHLFPDLVVHFHPDLMVHLYPDYAFIFHVRRSSLNKEYKSVLRNPIITHAFFLANNIESWGRGTNKVFDECKAYGIPDPVYKSYGKVVEVRLQGHVWEVSDKRQENLGKRKLQIIDLITQNPNIIVPQLAETIELSERSILRHLKDLQDQKLIARVGGRKEGHWKIL